ncbi:hypothetical protein [Pseudomonas cremoricolorata]|uniref:Translation initiation factor 2 n=1 Tax=Pseudomonas cremoricolorata TaxID=157783 RepID=A0A089WUV2_9PSED|nr:hypothetical protein [Pseudomonas cremoricolorata]AIR90342.1 hypothetical protein LK03_14030 [Pseudomonas cremoricolorata]
MKTLRCIALLVGFSAFSSLAGLVQAAQPSDRGSAAVQSAPATGMSKAKPAASAKTPARKSNSSRKPVAKKPVSKAVTQPVPATKIDLSLPKDMVKDLKPELDSSPVAHTPLLPAMFPDTPGGSDSNFQLNGRLISNEMQLQLRNESRRDLEGAAIEFEFKQ